MAPRPHQEVKTVRQQNISVQFHLIAQKRPPNQVQEVRTIDVARKNSLSPIAPRRQVIDRSLQLNSKRSGRFIFLRIEATNVKIFRRDPLLPSQSRFSQD
jgi:hypothetical protein